MKVMTLAQAAAILNALEQEIGDDAEALDFFRRNCRQPFLALLTTGRVSAVKDAMPTLLAVPPERIAKPKHYKVWSYKGTRAQPFDRGFLKHWKALRETMETINLAQYGLGRR